ncbi:MAG: hypothetical protein ACXVQJ_03910 [Actinomycetota bacterium]
MTATEYRMAETLANAVDERMDAGVRTLEEQATALMREVAKEVWRSSARDVRPEQERIVTLLSRDQAIRSLIASSDERFQALAVRTARLEDHLNEIQAAERSTREAMENSAHAIREIANSPTLHGVDTVRSQLEQVELHIAEAFAHIDEREKLLTDTVLGQVREHGELIAGETTRVVEAMQSYVQGGAEAMGHLAQRIEQHAQAFVTQDHDLNESVRAIVEEQTTEFTEQLALVREKVGLHGREQADLRAAVERLIEARVRGLAELVRSDSMALREMIEQRMASLTLEGVEFDEIAMIQAVDERMGMLERVVEERMSSLERSFEEQVLALSMAMTATVERNLDRMVSAAESVNGLDEMVAETQQAFEERMGAQLDDRLTAIARLIRSDNKVLAERIDGLQTAPAAVAAEPGIDADLIRGLVRSMKELEAGVSGDVMSAVDHRFQSVSEQMHRDAQLQAEAMLKVAEVLSDKIDRLSVRVDEAVGNDVQIVVDRMSDAIRAMSSMRREAS